MRQLALLVCLSVVVGAGCKPRSGGGAPGPGPAVDADRGLTGGTLVASEDFGGAELPAGWRAAGSAWKVEDGWLSVAGARNDALWFQTPLPDQVRVEFLAMSLSPEGDLKFEIFGDGSTHESGYVGIFGGWRNSLNIIARLDEHGDDRLVGAEGVQVEPNRTYRMAVVRTDARLRWYVDGELFLTYDDPAPLRGPEHAFFAFNDWDVPVRFDEFRVFDLGTP